MRTRDRHTNLGLLPRMEARPLKRGGFSFRYHPYSGKPIDLGRDRIAAIQKVLDMTNTNTDAGTIEEVYEPFLIQEGYLMRTPRGREVTEKAFKHLGINKPKNPGELF